jgi:hypothetical protein
MNYDQYYVSLGINEPNLFRINIPISEMKKAYKKGIEIIGFDPFNEFLSWDSYSEFSFIKFTDKKYIDALEKHKLSELFEHDDVEEKGINRLFMHEDYFHNLYLMICKLGNSFFNYTELSESNTIHFYDR